MHFVKHKEPIIVSAVKSDGSTFVGQELDFLYSMFGVIGHLISCIFWLDEQLQSCS